MPIALHKPTIEKMFQQVQSTCVAAWLTSAAANHTDEQVERIRELLESFAEQLTKACADTVFQSALAEAVINVLREDREVFDALKGAGSVPFIIHPDGSATVGNASPSGSKS